MSKPINKFLAGNVSAAVWENKIPAKTGGEISVLSVSVNKNYKTKEGEWKSTNSFGVNDLAKLKLVVDKAFEFCVVKEKEVKADG